MVKTNRFPRGHSSGFSHRPVDNMSDSEGFGSSGRVDTEMAASEGSCAPKRKSISLSVDKCDYFGVPMQVISVANMRQWEKKNLKLRLRAELDQIRLFRKKIALRFTNGVALSSSSVIHSSSNVQKVPPVHGLQKSSEKLSGKIKKSETLAGKGKKRALPGQNDGSRVNRGSSGKFESAKQVAGSSTSHVMLMNQCDSLLQRLMTHQFGSVFNTPVDVVKFKIPDYFTVIKHPMDLGTVKKKLTSGVYSGPLDFLADVRLTFSNAMTYNPVGNNVHTMAAALSKYFEIRWKSIEKKLSVPDAKLVPVKPDVSKEAEAVMPKEMPPLKKRKVSSVEHKVKPNIVKRIMTIEEKHKLNRDLGSIEDMPGHIIDFLRERTFNPSQTGGDEIEVDFNDFSDDALLTLRKLVDDHLRGQQMNQGKTKSSGMEILNGSRFGNSSVQPCKVNNHADEDVDIGENDAHVLSYPPVEIEKDAAPRKCSSSSSSSSDSGSSSGDTESGNSSDSQSDGVKALPPTPRNKETLSSAEVLVPKTDGPVIPYDGNQAVSCLDQLEQTSQPRPVSVEADSRQEEVSTPSERQVSPGKLYRAALLRGRFADTILKARAKALDPGKKGDPEKLRREREELERQQREEKARLQAEAKAAEDARKQVEAEAAAEVKRQRQLEREAARQALLKMEKTVEINENCPLLEDLEMLRVPPEHVPSSVDESSPAHSGDALGSFRLRGSTNPLEQLGLYMKVDEEEEEEGDVLDPGNEVEEGEID